MQQQRCRYRGKICSCTIVAGADTGTDFAIVTRALITPGWQAAACSKPLLLDFQLGLEQEIAAGEADTGHAPVSASPPPPLPGHGKKLKVKDSSGTKVTPAAKAPCIFQQLRISLTLKEMVFLKGT
ncbi:hypothetical protein WISP_53501 [Willisornis vidua]|uniref:Uncharacterized protein n=1 Tax=Willisornis vidua TaxID=1566151 RepID=A0ABQ9DJ57_9PASS|nr:hypothetical protein WISP_53501 [Willisornis vidua]